MERRGVGSATTLVASQRACHNVALSGRSLLYFISDLQGRSKLCVSQRLLKGNYDFPRIIIGFAYENKTSYAFLSLPRTS